MSNTLMHILNLHWIIIEDSEQKTDLVKNFLKSTQMEYTHLNIRTQRNLQMATDDPRWMKHRCLALSIS